MSIDTILSVDDGDFVKAGQVIARIPKESSKQKILQVDYLELPIFLKLENQKIQLLLVKLMES